MTALHLAGPDDLDRLLPMVAACHAEIGIEQTDEGRAAGIAPLLEGSPHGAIYLFGPARAPIGYAAICFGWSLATGGLDGVVEEIWIRPGVRGRGIGSEVLTSLPRALAGAGLTALHIELPQEDERLDRFCRRLKFSPQPGHARMTRQF